ncbi:tumor necrosis factor receptor superfamily member 1B-like [Ylistrum balloti]|uniref:tumor necrosis factor receptor superfamily member 1B-like n=1 Tax=Ylistrum balloti TaxID=509963 RepID=UPI002905A7C4|nr:tumor necrosis factor receptor superfamily member 1B-like [Ylistrum balloti]
MLLPFLVLMSFTVHQTEGHRLNKATCQTRKHHFLDISLKGETLCKTCTSCRPGYKQVTRCTKVNNTHCEPCRPGTYAYNNAKRCHPCRHCVRGRRHGRKCRKIEKAQCWCPKRTYYRRGNCIPCTRCQAGSYVKSRCSFTKDTNCQECPQGTFFSRSKNFSKFCAKCHECRHGEMIDQPCNSTHDTVCGKCKPGMFRLVSSGECVLCSYCYPDVNGSYSDVIIVDECRTRNPDQSRICMPSAARFLEYSNNTDLNSTVKSVSDEVEMNSLVSTGLFEGDYYELISVVCIVLTLCVLSLSLSVYIRMIFVKRRYSSSKCENKSPTAQRNLMDEYLAEQRSSNSNTIVRSNSELIAVTKTYLKRQETTLSLETGKKILYREDEFYSPIIWSVGKGPSSITSYSDMFSVSTTENVANSLT